MIEQRETPTPKIPAPTAEAADFSAEIAGQLDREPADRVSCRHIYGNWYRCNWWAPSAAAGYDNPAMYGLTVTTHRVRKSEFLHVTRTKKGLAIRAR